MMYIQNNYNEYKKYCDVDLHRLKKQKGQGGRGVVMNYQLICTYISHTPLYRPHLLLPLYSLFSLDLFAVAMITIESTKKSTRLLIHMA